MDDTSGLSRAARLRGMVQRKRGLATGYAALFALLFSIYTLTNAGRVHVIDEVGIFAVTESLVLRGEVNTNAIAWTQWADVPGEVLGAFGEYGNVYSNQGPGPAFAAVPWFWLLRGFALLNMEVGMLQGLLLWNGIITAATAILLWNMATRLGYSQHVGCALALLFGLTTIAWPYANLLFGEPLSAFGLLLCFWGLTAWRHVGRNRFAFAGGLGAAIALTTVIAHGAIVGAFALLALVSMVRHGVPIPESARNRMRRSAAEQARPAGADSDGEPDTAISQSAEEVDATDVDESNLATLRFGTQVGLFLGPVMLAIIFIFTYNSMRFGSVFETGSQFEAGEGFTAPLAEGFWGLVLSPYRGLFWHTPLLLLSLLSFPLFLRRHRLEAASVLAGSALLVGIYSMWWMWWDGIGWGPRFLVPFTPFWVLTLAPLVAASAQRRVDESGGQTPDGWFAWARGWRIRLAGWLLLVFAGISLVVQVGAVSANFVNYEIELRSRYPANWSDPLRYDPPAQSLSNWSDSPVIGQFRQLATRQAANLDFAWIWPDGDVRWLVVLIGVAVVMTTALLLGLWLVRTSPGGAWTPSGPLAWLLLILPALLTAVWLGESASHPYYGAQGTGYRAIVTEICEQARADDVVITLVPFAYQIPMNWMGAHCGTTPEVLGYAVDSLQHPETETALARALDLNRRVFLVTGGIAPNDPDNLVERRLSEVAHKADDTWYDDYRLVVYGTDNALEEAPWFPISTPLVGRGTSQIVVLAARMPDVVQAGDVLATELYFELGAPSPSNLRWFVQLLADSGEPVALLDTAPQDGYVSFMDLPAEQEVMDRAGMWVPPDTPTGNYLLIAGLYNPDDPEAARLRAPDGRDHVELGTVRVIGGEVPRAAEVPESEGTGE